LQVSQWYEIVIFTASMEIYGSAVSDKLDGGRNILMRRYFRQVINQLGAVCPSSQPNGKNVLL
jgi:TFIIF-interacting CTD phosphatase-like protein